MYRVTVHGFMFLCAFPMDRDFSLDIVFTDFFLSIGRIL